MICIYACITHTYTHTPLLGPVRPFPALVNLEIGAMITVSMLEDAPRLKKKDRYRCNDHRLCAPRRSSEPSQCVECVISPTIQFDNFFFFTACLLYSGAGATL